MCQQLRYRLLLWHVNKSKGKVLFLRFNAFDNWWKGFTHSVSSTCFGLGILYPSWSLSAIWRAFTSGYGDPPRWIDIEDLGYLVESARLSSVELSFLVQKQRVRTIVHFLQSQTLHSSLNKFIAIYYLVAWPRRNRNWRGGYDKSKAGNLGRHSGTSSSISVLIGCIIFVVVYNTVNFL